MGRAEVERLRELRERLNRKEIDQATYDMERAKILAALASSGTGASRSTSGTPSPGPSPGPQGAGPPAPADPAGPEASGKDDAPGDDRPSPEETAEESETGATAAGAVPPPPVPPTSSKQESAGTPGLETRPEEEAPPENDGGGGTAVVSGTPQVAESTPGKSVETPPPAPDPASAKEGPEPSQVEHVGELVNLPSQKATVPPVPLRPSGGPEIGSKRSIVLGAVGVLVVVVALAGFVLFRHGSAERVGPARVAGEPAPASPAPEPSPGVTSAPLAPEPAPRATLAPPTSTAVTAAAGSISIRWDQPATVSVDGHGRRQSPCTFEDLSPGMYTVTLSSPDGISVTRNVSVRAGETTYVRGSFPIPATLSINAIPWAEVHVDGEPKGSTPIQIRLAPGRHVVRLVRPGAEWTCNVELKPGEKRKVSHVF